MSNSPAVACGVMDRLRKGTRDLHEQLELNPLHSAIVSGAVTRETYCELLARMFGFHKSFEQQASGRCEWNDFGFDFAERSKLTAIRSDLAAMGWQQDLDSRPVMRLPLAHASFAFISGYLYVSEGSTLGGQVLMRQLAVCLGVSSTEGGVYFSGYGPLTAAKWKDCQGFLERLARAQETTGDELIAGARDAFSRLNVWLR